ncbi:MAG: hypothetical protein PHQ80_01450 [Candidatus ainarchaeum sp.]|nr:hypothetical protein [Candidatus ainarchaeum sp.]MDD5095901.1 hypothetical protein [Candidatus ainarchaeum sp.]
MKSVLALMAVMALAFSAAGTTTMQWPGSAFFRFSDGAPVSYDAAIAAGGDVQAEYDIALEPWNRPAWCTNFIDMGEVELESLAAPPQSGYNDDTQGFMDCTDVEAGHAYWIKTRDGKYAKVKVMEATYLGTDPTHGNMNRITFDWVYQGQGGGGGNAGCLPAALIAMALGALFIWRPMP